MMVELFDDVPDRLQLTDGWLARVRSAQRFGSTLLNVFQRLFRQTRFVRHVLRLSQLRGHLLFGLLAQLEHLLKTKFENAHDAFLVTGPICCAIDWSALVDVANAVLSSGNCWRNSRTRGRSRS